MQYIKNFKIYSISAYALNWKVFEDYKILYKWNFLKVPEYILSFSISNLKQLTSLHKFKIIILIKLDYLHDDYQMIA